MPLCHPLLWSIPESLDEECIVLSLSPPVSLLFTKVTHFLSLSLLPLFFTSFVSPSLSAPLWVTCFLSPVSSSLSMTSVSLPSSGSSSRPESTTSFAFSDLLLPLVFLCFFDLALCLPDLCFLCFFFGLLERLVNSLVFLLLSVPSCPPLKL